DGVAWVGPAIAREKLQWCHVLADVETETTIARVEAMVRASMVPRPCGRGNSAEVKRCPEKGLWGSFRAVATLDLPLIRHRCAVKGKAPFTAGLVPDRAPAGVFASPRCSHDCSAEVDGARCQTCSSTICGYPCDPGVVDVASAEFRSSNAWAVPGATIPRGHGFPNRLPVGRD